MNINLQTNSQSKKLELQNIKKTGNNYKCFLIVNSRGFCVSRSFSFSDYYLKLFLENIIEMNLTFAGEAILKDGDYDDDYISITCEKTGHISVSGELIEYSEHPQSLNFCFQTDQTVLSPLIRDISKLIQC